MSVRVCYLKRGERGVSLRGLRLVGQATDTSWPENGSFAGTDLRTYEDGAEWVHGQLAKSRDTQHVSLLVLDVEGGVCSWLSSPTADRQVVGALARGGSEARSDSDSAERRSAGAVEFYAPSEMDSSIEPLVAAGGHDGIGRLAVLGVADVPARLMIDALDRRGAAVEGVGTIWHAMASAWDPGAARANERTVRGDVVAESSAPVCAVVMIEPHGRALWCWSREGKLLVAGSLRLRMQRQEGNEDETGELLAAYGDQDVSRLTSEWLAWAVQISAAPSRIVCVIPEAASGSPAEFGEALGKAWPGAAVDVAVHEDPVGVTLRRLADGLEATPASEGVIGSGLAELSARPGRLHRRMYLWAGVAVAGLAVVTGLAAWRLRAAAGEARSATLAWNEKWTSMVKSVDADVVRGGIGVGNSPIDLLKAEIDKREKVLLPVTPTERVMPIVQELETISLVVGAAGFDLESIDLSSTPAAGPKVIVIAPSTADAEALADALERVQGSYVIDWSATYFSQAGKDGRQVVKGTYTGKWDPALLRANPTKPGGA